jgi:methionyl-tRNA formyltransferase
VPSPVKAAAVELGLGDQVTTRVEDVIGSGAQLGVVVAFGRLVKPPVLEALPMVNVHFSLLPRWRGAAPVERAILAGDDVTGVCLMELEEGLDTGPVLGRRVVPIGAEETADELRRELSVVGTDLLLEQLGAGLSEAVSQEGEATYAAKIDPAELRLDWALPAAQLHRVVRIGRAWTTFRGRRLGVLRATVGPAGDSASGELAVPGAVAAAPLAPGELALPPAIAAPPGVAGANAVVAGTGEGTLGLLEVQPEGRAAMAARAWANGARLRPGERLE